MNKHLLKKSGKHYDGIQFIRIPKALAREGGSVDLWCILIQIHTSQNATIQNEFKRNFQLSVYCDNLMFHLIFLKFFQIRFYYSFCSLKVAF